MEPEFLSQTVRETAAPTGPLALILIFFTVTCVVLIVWAAPPGTLLRSLSQAVTGKRIGNLYLAAVAGSTELWLREITRRSAVFFSQVPLSRGQALNIDLKGEPRRRLAGKVRSCRPLRDGWYEIELRRERPPRELGHPSPGHAPAWPLLPA